MNDLHITPNLRVYSKNEAKVGLTSGRYVGTVDHFDGGHIKLRKKGSPDGKHHWIPANWVSRVDEKSVHLHKTREDIFRDCLNECPMTSTEGVSI